MVNEELADISEVEKDIAPVAKKETKKYDKPLILPKGQGQTWPIVGRVLVNRLRSEAKTYHVVHDHQLEVGGKFISVPCMRSFEKPCPFCDAYWDAWKAEKRLTTEGAALATAGEDQLLALKKAQVAIKILKQRQRYAILLALPKDPNVYMFFMGPAMLKELFGDADKGTTGAITQLKDTYKVAVLNAQEPVGWIWLNRTGEKLDTRYSAKPAVIEVIEGRTKTEKLMEEPLHPTVKEKVDKNDLPKIYEYNMSRAWTAEEMENFLASSFTQLPERYKALFEQEEPKETKVDQAAFTTEEMKAPDVPW